MYNLPGAPASRNRAAKHGSHVLGWGFEVTALEEKFSAGDACESPWQHERFEAAIVESWQKPPTFAGQQGYTFGDIRIQVVH